MTHRLFWLPPSPPVGSADSPLPEGALQSVTEPQRDRRPLPIDEKRTVEDAGPYKFFGNRPYERQPKGGLFMRSFGVGGC